MANIYDIGDQVLLEATVKTRTTIGGALTLTTPTTAACRVTKPDGTTVAVDVAVLSPGVLQAIYTPDDAGLYAYSFTGTGAAVGYEEGSFEVRARRVGTL